MTQLKASIFSPSVASSALFLLIASVGCGGSGGAPTNGTEDPTATGTTPVSSVTNATSASASAAGSSSTSTTHAVGHHRCGWIGADTAADGVASFSAHPDFFDAVHPKWFTLNADGSPRSIAFTDDPTVLSVARAHHVQLIPLIDTVDVVYLRGIISSPANIATHVSQLVAIVTSHNYDGIELDYERLWDAGDRAGFTALVTQAAAALHAQGKVLTLALPAIQDEASNNGYDYAALSSAADVLHLMGYDFHYEGGDHLGPLAPIGWIENVTKRVEKLGSPQKFVLGVANYAIGNGWYTNARDAAARCGANYDTETDHMSHCPLGSEAAGRQPHCTTSQGDVWFEDVGSMSEKVASAVAHHLGGIGYWTIGVEPDGFFDMIRASYP